MLQLLEEGLHLLECGGAGLPRVVVAEGGCLPLQLLEVAVAERRLAERVRLLLRPLEVLQHRALVHQARELVVEPLDEGDDVLDVHERRALHLLDQEPDEVALPLHVRFDRKKVSRPVLDFADHVARRRHAAAVRRLRPAGAVPPRLPPHHGVVELHHLRHALDALSRRPWRRRAPERPPRRRGRRRRRRRRSSGCGSADALTLDWRRWRRRTRWRRRRYRRQLRELWQAGSWCGRRVR
uniref:Uncharacterized protein n=1 Tax=Arundo donax TaxID=35708 RepID=A0A0A9CIX2_ARUDO